MTETIHIHYTLEYPRYPIVILCGIPHTYGRSASVDSLLYRNCKLYDKRYTICQRCLESELLPMLELASIAL